MNFSQIDSRDNQKLKLARSVRDGRATEFVFVEGLRLGEEVLKTSLQFESVFVTEKCLQSARGKAIVEKLSNVTSGIFRLDDKVFDSIAETKTSQGLIIIAQKPVTGKATLERQLSQLPLILLLHRLNNPSNLGAILRTAEAVGIDGIITTKATSDIFSAKTLRGAMGANLRIPIWSDATFSEVVWWAKQNGLISICADIRSEKSYLQIDWNVPRLLVFGSEAHGLSEQERIQMDESLIIPMANGVESLNVAVASGIILFEAKRQREVVKLMNG